MNIKQNTQAQLTSLRWPAKPCIHITLIPEPATVCCLKPHRLTYHLLYVAPDLWNKLWRGLILTQMLRCLEQLYFTCGSDTRSAWSQLTSAAGYIKNWHASGREGKWDASFAQSGRGSGDSGSHGFVYSRKTDLSYK